VKIGDLPTRLAYRSNEQMLVTTMTVTTTNDPERHTRK